jgi:hypothetical protein
VIAGSPQALVLLPATIRHAIVLQYECAGKARIARKSLGDVGRRTA